jgi:hypothetical protein
VTYGARRPDKVMNDRQFEVSAMRKRIRWAILLLVALPVLGFLGAWLLVPNADLAEQKRLEILLLGKTLDETQTAMGRKPDDYKTREQCRKLYGECRWPAGKEAIAHWWSGRGDAISVAFDGNGTATWVLFQSSFSMRRRSWGLP